MTQPLDVKRKVLIGLSVTMMIGALGAGAYSLLPTNNPTQSSLQPTLTTVTNEVPYQLPANVIEPQPTMEQPTLTQTAQPTTPPTQPINTVVPDNVTLILTLSEKIQLSELRSAADKAALVAKNAKTALNGHGYAPSQLDALFENTASNGKITNALDTIRIKSLVSTQVGVSGYITIGNELMPIKKGTRIGDIRVIDMTAQYVDFSFQGKTARKYLGS